MRQPFLLLLLSFCSLMLPAAPVRAGWAEDRKATNELRQRTQELEKTNPEQAVTAYRTFLEGHPDLFPAYGVELASLIAGLCSTRLKQPDKALQICDWAIETYKDSRFVAGALGAKAAVLNREKRHIEAQELLEKCYDQVMAGERDQIGPAVQRLAAALDAQGKRKEATAAVRKALAGNGHLLHYWWQGQPPGWMYERVVKECIAQNRLDEALSWGKLFFVCASAMPGSTKDATAFLGRIWQLKDMSDRNARAFAEALQEPAKPNPLADVRLPELDVEGMTATIDRPLEPGTDRCGILNALIATGRMREALVMAKECHARFSDDVSAEMVRRVLKAATLSLKTGEAFDTFRKTGQGPNPMDELAKNLAEEAAQKPGEGKPAAREDTPAGEGKPAGPRKAEAKGETLGYVKDAADDKRNLPGTGFAVAFQCPGKAGCVSRVRICATRTGAAEGKLHLYILDEKMQVLADLPFAYAAIGTGELRWYDLDVPSIEVPRQFAVGLDFRPDAQKAIHLGLHRDAEKTHSFVGLPAKGYQKMTQPVEWMVRVVVSGKPAGKGD